MKSEIKIKYIVFKGGAKFKQYLALSLVPF
jgi:hypothetical protein